MTRYTGSCHCGAVRFEIEADPVETTSCDCSICAKKNARMIQVHESGFTLVAGEEFLSTYQWNMRIARHHFCARCGIYTFHRKRMAPDSYGINIYCLDGFDERALPHRRTEGAALSVAEE
ncbi:GFA family protein [Parasphingopyxis marina]|uniref:GFA family protein n=1 Tax=Parasphingopyxis marina TaxID=2761622 RepID=A0A842HYW5_9SPHN|nr:GFA family protein [Parasphingopyxis marina]MBC2778122.1 GFA family protein [Parasphingopyxis marina]